MTPRRRRQLWIAAAAFLGTLGGVVGVLAWRDAALSQPPPRRADPAAAAIQSAPPTDSRVAVVVETPYPIVAAMVEQGFDGFAGTKSGVMEAECVEILGARECLELHWRLRYDRAGAVTAQADQGGLRLTLPGKMDAQVGFSGLPARLLGLDRKAVTGRFAVSARVKASLGEDYCPRVDVSDVRFDWIGGAAFELLPRRDLKLPGGKRVSFGPVRLPLGDLLEDDLTVLLRGLARKAAANIPCASLRAQLRDQWTARRLTAPRPAALGPGPEVAVTLAPRALTLADPVAAPDALRLGAAFVFGLGVAPADAPPSQVETPALPLLKKLQDETGRLSLAAPVSLSYGDVAAAIRGALPQPLTFESPLGPGEAVIRELTVWPTAPQLTLAVDLTARWPARKRSVDATLWLSARPSLDDAERLVLEEVSLRRRIDDRLLAWGAAAVHGTLTEKLSGLRFDLKPALARAADQAAAAARAAAAPYGLDLSLKAPRLTLGRMYLGEDLVTLEVGAEAELRAKLLGLKLP